MRIGCFQNIKQKKVIMLLQRVPEDCPYEEDNYPGTDPSQRIKEIENVGYSVFSIWWKDIQGDIERFRVLVDKFMKTNYYPEMNS